MFESQFLIIISDGQELGSVLLQILEGHLFGGYHRREVSLNTVILQRTLDRYAGFDLHVLFVQIVFHMGCEDDRLAKQDYPVLHEVLEELGEVGPCGHGIGSV